MRYPHPYSGRLLSTLLAFTLLPHLSAISIWINEIHYDNADGDTGEFVEIAGIAGTDLANYSLTLYNGSTGATYGSIALSGLLLNQSNGFGALAFFKSGIQNGNPDGLFLSGPSASLFMSYGGIFAATNGPASGLTSTDIGVQEGSSTQIGYSLQITGTGSTYADFTWSSPSQKTDGAINNGQTLIAESIPEGVSTIGLLGLGLCSLLMLKSRLETK
jgi:uncharacterized protein